MDSAVVACPAADTKTGVQIPVLAVGIFPMGIFPIASLPLAARPHPSGEVGISCNSVPYGTRLENRLYPFLLR